MSPCIFKCPICGWMICDEDGSVSWMNQFRGYSEEGIILTGVGLYADPQSGAFVAPRDSSARWDDPSYGNPGEDQFGAMSQAEVNGRHGFVFHDACWSLLQEAYQPTPVPLKRLLEVLDSLPMVWAGGSVDWGHDYGGLAILREKNYYYPWEHLRFADRTFRDGWFDTSYSADPLAISEVEEILAETAQSPPFWNAQLPTRGQDPFNKLPEELCLIIATHLPTSDVLNARRASRSFCRVFNSQSFWASRFRGKSSERSWLFEAARDLERTGGVGHRDWRWLYHRTADARLGRAARNRKRVWGLIHHLADILDACWTELPSELQSPWQRPALLEEPSPGPSWVLTAGNVRGWGQDFSPLQTGCARLKIQRVAIPAEGVSRVAVSTIRLGSIVYIAGLSLTATNGKVLRLGYGTEGSGHPVQIFEAAFTGFNVAVGLGGIHALQCISGTSTARQLSSWLGCPDDTPKTERLSVIGQNMVLEFGFDGFRMVSLAAQLPTPHMSTGRSLRSSAIWYPEVPHASLDLNEGFLVEPQEYTSGYRPLFWSCFGGPGGIYLSNLVKITIIGVIDRIEFSFDIQEVPAECRSFGRMGDWEDDEIDDNDGVVEFPIDGPGGEVLDRVELLQELFPEESGAADWLCKEGQLTWLKIYTNRGRMCEVGLKSESRKRHVVRKELSAPSITGFYGCQYRHLGSSIISLGVITEPVLETEK
ncbi:uncharacterized protein B0T15DRAFT_188618 [Chaetomium strumarium]|uniref:F-box domain-containing protein n=1 Tax=Chaetomium strumarium TaxID=1170767 RepID=A0AAJ0M134_9PEZI|nr:hypothetical protein B0T15DRAFT_188618 [Chaetomium strumarium]